ncbi:hypothetical protein CSA37_01250 [Candidatus Fermentibacteria bacterium]|nr:MAG: hypothetical protein CSA37_13500 [Candidatus Fermentibacteria bacterium]PIE51914.1 MAG: hypothetical protein CSA37_09035 [Candidatus Fermentibacteria bacterium]PIE53476.1 MAG: hypothetical protein CSA37_01250 [Candidatus Fermentibacteria bacterium]
MESSSDGLWEDSSQYNLNITRLHHFGGEDDPNPQFYYPVFVKVEGDTIFVTDAALQSLICIDSTGSVLWTFGEAGEGPGHFAGIGQVDVCGDYIAVVNNGLSAIELLHRDGTYVRRLSIDRPQDVSFVDSTHILVFSKIHDGGDVHCLDINTDSILFSFGCEEWEQWPNSGSVYEIYGLYLEPATVVYLSHFEMKMFFADFENSHCFSTEIRELPFSITEHGHSYDEDSNMRFDIAYPLYRSMSIGPHGEINTIFTNLMSNGEMYGPGNNSDYPPVTVIDRFDVNGNYLDSYCLPDSSICIIDYNGNGYMVGIQAHTGTIFGYSIDTL